MGEHACVLALDERAATTRSLPIASLMNATMIGSGCGLPALKRAWSRSGLLISM